MGDRSLKLQPIHSAGSRKSHGKIISCDLNEDQTVDIVVVDLYEFELHVMSNDDHLDPKEHTDGLEIEYLDDDRYKHMVRICEPKTNKINICYGRGNGRVKGSCAEEVGLRRFQR